MLCDIIIYFYLKCYSFRIFELIHSINITYYIWFIIIIYYIYSCDHFSSIIYLSIQILGHHGKIECLQKFHWRNFATFSVFIQTFLRNNIIYINIININMLKLSWEWLLFGHVQLYHIIFIYQYYKINFKFNTKRILASENIRIWYLRVNSMHFFKSKYRKLFFILVKWFDCNINVCDFISSFYQFLTIICVSIFTYQWLIQAYFSLKPRSQTEVILVHSTRHISTTNKLFSEYNYNVIDYYFISL